MWSVQEQTVSGGGVEVALSSHNDDSNTCYLSVNCAGHSALFIFQRDGSLLKVDDRMAQASANPTPVAASDLPEGNPAVSGEPAGTPQPGSVEVSASAQQSS